MVSKQTILRIGAVAFIGFFVLGFFWVLMYAREEQPTPTPTPQPSLFNGQAHTTARVIGFANNLFVYCNTTNPFFVSELREIQGVENAFSVTETGIVVELNESTADETIALINEKVELDCVLEKRVLRNAFLEITDALELSSIATVTAAGSTKKIYPKDLLDVFRALGSNSIDGFVSVSTKVNEMITVVVFVQMLGDKIVQKPTIEQPASPQEFFGELPEELPEEKTEKPVEQPPESEEFNASNASNASIASNDSVVNSS